MAKGFFVTGTDTGVGKTVIAGALIKAFEMQGLKPCGMKPIETGCTVEGKSLVPSDGLFLKSMAHMDEPVSLVTPCCLKNPLAPMVAADMEGVKIDIVKIRKSFDKLLRKYDSIIVEGIGGLLTPIKKNYFALDLAKEFRLPLIVVARPDLGTINHTLLTVKHAEREGLKVAGIVINFTYQPESNLAEETNPQTLKQLNPAPLIGIFPYLDSMTEDEFEKAILKNLNMDIIKEYL